MSVINTNYLALVSQNNLTKSQGALGTAIERLSSGLRINSAKDDAAGQAIANRFTANIKGLTQAARNANDGISIAQTTEGALNEINNNLQRIRELTVQAANGSNSPTDLDSIQDEITQRLAEIDRVSEQTQFNGIHVLSKEGALTIQVGAHDSQTIDINLKQINAEKLDLDDFTVASRIAIGDTGAATLKDSSDTNIAHADVTFTGTVTTVAAADFLQYTEGSDTKYLVRVGSGADAKFYHANVTNITDGTPSTATVNVGAEARVITSGDNAAAGKSSFPTENPLAALDAALSQVDQLRGELGAVQNRFQSTIANLNNTVNNLSAARSRIEDADYAVEVSNMTRAQILQQAGTSVLAQANQVPQTVLSLLR